MRVFSDKPEDFVRLRRRHCRKVGCVELGVVEAQSQEMGATLQGSGLLLGVGDGDAGPLRAGVQALSVEPRQNEERLTVHPAYSHAVPQIQIRP